MFPKALGQYVMSYDINLSWKEIPAAAATPTGSFVKKDGSPSTAGTASSFYGLHVGEGKVFYALCVLNAHGLAWPEGMTDAQKGAVLEQLEKTHVVVRGM